MKEYIVTYSTLTGEIKQTVVSAISKSYLESAMYDYDWEFEKIISIEYES